MSTSVIRPGLLVALKSTVSGGVSYERKDLPVEGETAKDTARWETIRTIEDPEEHKRASDARSLAVKEIRKVCSTTSFGLLCPESMEAELDAAVARARSIVALHNEGAKHTKVNVFALKGRIASSDTEAARAIGEEVSSLIEGMNDAIDRLDPAAIREAATKARQMSAMLSPELSQRVGEAVDAARRAARTIVKRVEKDGEQAAVVLADIQRGAIEKARIAFLDLGDDAPSPADAAAVLPSIDVQRFAGLADDDAPESASETPAVLDPAESSQPAPVVPFSPSVPSEAASAAEVA